MTPDEAQRHRQFLRSFTAHEPAIRSFVRRIVPSRADADDVMQDVSVVLWEKFETFREGGDFRAWAFGVARYEALAWVRDKARDRLVLDEGVVEKLADEAPEAEPRLHRQRLALERCLEKLDPEQRGLLLRAYQSNSAIQDVAAASGRSVAGFYQWLYRMRRTLLDCVRRALTQDASS